MNTLTISRTTEGGLFLWLNEVKLGAVVPKEHAETVMRTMDNLSQSSSGMATSFAHGVVMGAATGAYMAKPVDERQTAFEFSEGGCEVR